MVVEVGQSEPTTYVFGLLACQCCHYSWQIEDTVPAEWQVVYYAQEPDGAGELDVSQANKKNNNKSATKITWRLNADPNLPEIEEESLRYLYVVATTRERTNGKFAPTSCGALYLNDGADVYLIDPNTDEPWADPNTGEKYPPIYEYENLCIAAVSDVNEDGEIVRDGTGDEDGDGLSDWSEACEIGTDPCNPDTDGDGVPDGDDPEPLDPCIPNPDLC